MGICFQWSCKPIEGMVYSPIKENERKKKKAKQIFFCTIFKDDESLGTSGNI